LMTRCEGPCESPGAPETARPPFRAAPFLEARAEPFEDDPPLLAARLREAPPGDLVLDWPVLGMLDSLLSFGVPNKNQSWSKETGPI